MVEWIAFTYTLIRDTAKAVCSFFNQKERYSEEDKLVNLKTFDNSSFQQDAIKKGYIKFYWAKQNNVEEYRAKGYDILYEYDDIHKKKYRWIIKPDNLVLIAAKKIKN